MSFVARSSFNAPVDPSWAKVDTPWRSTSANAACPSLSIDLSRSHSTFSFRSTDLTHWHCQLTGSESYHAASSWQMTASRGGRHGRLGLAFGMPSSYLRALIVIHYAQVAEGRMSLEHRTNFFVLSPALTSLIRLVHSQRMSRRSQSHPVRNSSSFCLFRSAANCSCIKVCLMLWRCASFCRILAKGSRRRWTTLESWSLFSLACGDNCLLLTINFLI